MFVDKSLTAGAAKTSKHFDFMENKNFYTHYSFDILKNLFQEEKRLIPIRGKSDQLHIRPNLVRILEQFARFHEYSLATLHLGVYILDVYMDNYVISDFIEHQKFVGLVSLLLAAKSEDLDEKVPSIKDLLKMVDLSEDLGVDLRSKEELDPKKVAAAHDNFSVMYAKLEFLVFESLDFNTIRPTAMSFMNIFQNFILTDADDVNTEEYDTAPSSSELRAKGNDILKTLLSIGLNDIHFFNVLPSKLASAIIGVARKLLGIKNFWPDYIVEFTSYTEDDIRPLTIILLEKRIELLYHTKNEEEEVSMKDSGFISIDSDSEKEEEVKQVHKKRKLNRVGITYEVVD